MVAAVFLASRLLALARAQVSAMTRLTNSAPMALGINGVGTSLLPPYLLDDFDVDPETKRVLGVALEKTRVFLGLADDFADGIIAKRLIELAKAGECNPDLLCQGAIDNCGGICTGTDREIVHAPDPPA